MLYIVYCTVPHHRPTVISSFDIDIDVDVDIDMDRAEQTKDRDMLGCDPWLGRFIGWGLEAVEAVEAGVNKEMKMKMEMVDYMIRGKRKTIEME